MIRAALLWQIGNARQLGYDLAHGAPEVAVFAFLLLEGAGQMSQPARNPWPSVLRAAATNYYALFGLAILLMGLGLLWKARPLLKVTGALALLAAAAFILLVLHDIRREIHFTKTAAPQSTVPSR
jgi:hypothetical protein